MTSCLKMWLTPLSALHIITDPVMTDQAATDQAATGQVVIDRAMTVTMSLLGSCHASNELQVSRKMKRALLVVEVSVCPLTSYHYRLNLPHLSCPIKRLLLCRPQFRPRHELPLRDHHRLGLLLPHNLSRWPQLQ